MPGTTIRGLSTAHAHVGREGGRKGVRRSATQFAQPSTLNAEPSSLKPQPSTLNAQGSRLNAQHVYGEGRGPDRRSGGRS
eukprot:2809612-Rhodomonas_salina.1